MPHQESSRLKVGFIASNYYAFDAFRRLVKRGDIEPSFVVGLDERRMSQSGMSPFYYQGSRFVSYALGMGIPAWLTTDLNTDLDLHHAIKLQEPDLVLAMGWPDILKAHVLSLSRLGFLGVHPSWLPEYRGGAPLNWQFLDGCSEIGVSSFFFAPVIDGGNVVVQRRFAAGMGNVANFIEDVYIEATFEILSLSIDRILENDLGHHMNVDEGFYRKRRTPTDGQIDFSHTADEIRKFVRAQCTPFPNAFFRHHSVCYSVMDAAPCEGRANIGELIDIGYQSFVIGCRSGAVRLLGVSIKN